MRDKRAYAERRLADCPLERWLRARTYTWAGISSGGRQRRCACACHARNIEQWINLTRGR